MDIGMRIKTCREACNMSQQELARALWVSRNTVSNWENHVTTPDIESFVLMSALFGISIDDMVKEDPDVMARAVARDRNHLLLVDCAPYAAASPEEHDDRHARLRIELPEVSDPTFESYPAIDAVGHAPASHAPASAYRLVRSWAVFNAAQYRLEDGAGTRLGTIHRGKAMFFPYFSVRIDGYDRVDLKRDLKMGYGTHGISTVYRLVGDDLSFTGNVLGPEFGIMRSGEPLLHIGAHLSGKRTVFSLELLADDARPLAVGIAMALLLMRSFDCNLVRNA